MKYCDAKIASLAPQRNAATSVLCVTSRHQNNCDTQTLTMHSIWSWKYKTYKLVQAHTLHANIVNLHFLILSTDITPDIENHTTALHCQGGTNNLLGTAKFHKQLHRHSNGASFNLPSHTDKLHVRTVPGANFYCLECHFFQDVGEWMNPPNKLKIVDFLRFIVTNKS